MLLIAQGVLRLYNFAPFIKGTRCGAWSTNFFLDGVYVSLGVDRAAKTVNDSVGNGSLPNIYHGDCLKSPPVLGSGIPRVGGVSTYCRF